jgi:hypothetical protein
MLTTSKPQTRMADVGSVNSLTPFLLDQQLSSLPPAASSRLLRPGRKHPAMHPHYHRYVQSHLKRPGWAVPSRPPARLRPDYATREFGPDGRPTLAD